MNINFQQMQGITGMTLLEIIEIERTAAVESLPGCNVDTCTNEWHWCTGCEYHLENDGMCQNCN